MPSHNVHFAFVVAAATPFCWKTLAGNQAQREVWAIFIYILIGNDEMHHALEGSLPGEGGGVSSPAPFCWPLLRS